MSVVVAEGDERQQGVAQQESEHEAEEVGVVVHPGEQTDEEEDHGDGEELAERLIGMFEHGPGV